MGDEFRHFSHLSVRRNILGVPSLCYPLLQKFPFLLIQTLPNDCSHIDDVHLLYCARFINLFLFLTVVEPRHFFPSEMPTVDCIAKFRCYLISFLFI